MDRTLCEIASAIRTPLNIDNVAKNRVFSHNARMLVDMDLSCNIFNEIVVYVEGFLFSI